MSENPERAAEARALLSSARVNHQLFTDLELYNSMLALVTPWPFQEGDLARVGVSVIQDSEVYTSMNTLIAAAFQPGMAQEGLMKALTRDADVPAPYVTETLKLTIPVIQEFLDVWSRALTSRIKTLLIDGRDRDPPLDNVQSCIAAYNHFVTTCLNAADRAIAEPTLTTGPPTTLPDLSRFARPTGDVQPARPQPPATPPRAPPTTAAYRGALPLIQSIFTMVDQPKNDEQFCAFVDAPGETVTDVCLEFRLKVLQQMFPGLLKELRDFLNDPTIHRNSQTSVIWHRSDVKREYLNEMMVIHLADSRRFQSFRLGTLLAVLEQGQASALATPERDFFELDTKSRVTQEIENRYRRSAPSVAWTMPYGEKLPDPLVTAEAFKTTRDFEARLLAHKASEEVRTPSRAPRQPSAAGQTAAPTILNRSTAGRCRKCLRQGHRGDTCPDPYDIYDDKAPNKLLGMYSRGVLDAKKP